MWKISRYSTFKLYQENSREATVLWKSFDFGRINRISEADILKTF